MKILAVDNDSTTLQYLYQHLKDMFPLDDISKFTSPLAAIRQLSEFPTDTALVFSTLLLRPIHIFDLAGAVRRLTPGATLILVTQTDNDELRALVKQVLDVDCIAQPVTVKALRDATDFLFQPCQWEDCEGCVCDWCKERELKTSSAKQQG